MCPSVSTVKEMATGMSTLVAAKMIPIASFIFVAVIVPVTAWADTSTDHDWKITFMSVAYIMHQGDGVAVNFFRS